MDGGTDGNPISVARLPCLKACAAESNSQTQTQTKINTNTNTMLAAKLLLTEH